MGPLPHGRELEELLTHTGIARKRDSSPRDHTKEELEDEREKHTR